MSLKVTKLSDLGTVDVTAEMIKVNLENNNRAHFFVVRFLIVLLQDTAMKAHVCNIFKPTTLSIRAFFPPNNEIIHTLAIKVWTKPWWPTTYFTLNICICAEVNFQKRIALMAQAMAMEYMWLQSWVLY